MGVLAVPQKQFTNRPKIFTNTKGLKSDRREAFRCTLVVLSGQKVRRTKSANRPQIFTNTKGLNSDRGDASRCTFVVLSGPKVRQKK